MDAPRPARAPGGATERRSAIRRAVLALAPAGVALISLVLAFQAPSARAAALPTPTGSFGINPAGIHVIGEPGATLTPTQVVNTTSSPYTVNVFPVMLTQGLSGAFAFSSSATDLARADQILSVSPSSFTLAPNSETPVQLHWNGMPSAQPEAVVGLIFQGVADRQSGPVHIVTRLLSVNYLRLPGDVEIHGHFTGLGAQQAGPRALQMLVRVANTGTRAWAPTDGLLTIRDSADRVVDRVRWAGAVVIPGAERDFPVTISRTLPAGAYTMTATMSFNGPETITSHFTLGGADQLPTPRLAIRDFGAIGTVGSPAVIAAKILSTGSAPAGVRLHLTLTGSSGAALAHHFAAEATLAFGLLAAGHQRTVDQTLGRPLVPGAYNVTAGWMNPDGTPGSLEVSFIAGAHRSALGRLASWIGGNLALLLLAVLLVCAGGWAVVRRQKLALEAELARTQARLAGEAGAD